PETIPLVLDINPGSILQSFRSIACDEEAGTPLLMKDELLRFEFPALASIENAELFVGKALPRQKADEPRFTLIARYNEGSTLGTVLPDLGRFGETPMSFQASDTYVSCSKRQFKISKFESYNKAGELIAIGVPTSAPYNDIQPVSPMGHLLPLLCPTAMQK